MEGGGCRGRHSCGRRRDEGPGSWTLGPTPGARAQITVISFCTLDAGSQGLEKRDEVLFLPVGKSEAESMLLHGKRPGAVWSESGRHIIGSEPLGIEPIFERGAPSAMTEHATVPNAF